MMLIRKDRSLPREAPRSTFPALLLLFVSVGGGQSEVDGRV
jgi:hypothetical protein